MRTTYREVWRYGAMKALLTMSDGDLICIEASGLVSRHEMERFRRDAVRAMMLPDAIGMVVDFRRAIVLLGSSDVPVEEVRIPHSIAAMPVAIVCAGVDEPLFLAHAWSQAQLGLIRAVFTDPDPASAWVLARAGGSSAWGE